MKKTLKKFFSKRKEIRFAYLFGSQAQKKTTQLSDVDIAVFIEEKFYARTKNSFSYQAGLITDLIFVLKTENIDVVILNEAPPLLAHRVIRDGILIDCKDELERIYFQVKAIREYIDTQKIRYIEDKYLRERIYSNKFGSI
ncbi:MAG: nucleotidyltransferase domain-containing protein [Elusimicrobiota bacterium]|nr:nucleotidyltransferase domain-containing protein [Elusimicrobiota bacterium]